MYNDKIIAFIIDVNFKINEIKRQLIEVIKTIKDYDQIYLINSDNYLKKGQAVASLSKYPFGEFVISDLIRHAIENISIDELDKLVIIITDKEKIDDFKTKQMLEKLYSINNCEVKFVKLLKESSESITIENLFETIIQYI